MENGFPATGDPSAPAGGESHGRCILIPLIAALATPVISFADDDSRGPAAERLTGLLAEVGSPKVNLAGLDQGTVESRRRAADNHAALKREQVGGDWFAALVSTSPDDEFKILRRFRTPAELHRHVQGTPAVLESWTYGPGGKPSRRLRARELSERTLSGNPPPTFLTATFPDPRTGTITSGRLEFGFTAAATREDDASDYRQSRHLQAALLRVLGTRAADGSLSPRAQWEALRAARNRGEIPLAELPPPPLDDHDLFVACECAVDSAGRISRAVRVYRASQISHQNAGGIDALFLSSGNGPGGRTAVAMHLESGSGPPVAGRDPIAVRVRDETEADPRRWNLLQFGEPWILRETALAQLGLINAYLADQRRELAWRKSNYDRFAEPLFAGLNIWGGATGAGFPWGNAVRLAYNATVTRALTPGAPSPRELQDLLRHVAAKSRHPRLRQQPGKTLTPRQLEELKQNGARLSGREVEEALQTIGRDDLAAMLSFPSWHVMDSKYRLYVDLLTDFLKVTGESESGTLRDIFNDPRYSPNGELSISNTLAIALGHESITPLSGVSLEQLLDGDGPDSAWLQYLNLSVDLRAVANTLSLLRHRHEADRELRVPFGHAPRLDNLAAYEFRIFGYPTLFWHKRNLLKQELDAYRNDFAYGIEGTEVVEHFDTRQEFLERYRAGQFELIGYVWIPQGPRRHARQSSLPVFGHRLPSGKTAIVIYGLDAYRQHAALMGRELRRFRQYERMLVEGGVIVRRLDPRLPESAREPRLWVGREAVATRFSPLLEDLLEYQRLLRFESWGIPGSRDDRKQRARLEAALRQRGVAAGPGMPDPLEQVDSHFSSFTYRTGGDCPDDRVQVIHLPAAADLNQAARLAAKDLQIEATRRHAAGLGRRLHPPPSPGNHAKLSNQKNIDRR